MGKAAKPQDSAVQVASNPAKAGKSKTDALKAALPAKVSSPPVTQPKKRKHDELDDIFSKKPAPAGPTQKDVAQVAAAIAASAATRRPSAPATSKKLAGSKDDIFGAAPVSGRNRTPEGYAVYSEQELGLDRRGGGDTDQCPFDCECCF